MAGRMGRGTLARSRVPALYDDSLDLAGAGPAEGGGRVVFVRDETGDALLEGREFDDE
jgi:hypothetical protein